MLCLLEFSHTKDIYCFACVKVSIFTRGNIQESLKRATIIRVFNIPMAKMHVGVVLNCSGEFIIRDELDKVENKYIDEQL